MKRIHHSRPLQGILGWWDDRLLTLCCSCFSNFLFYPYRQTLLTPKRDKNPGAQISPGQGILATLTAGFRAQSAMATTPKVLLPRSQLRVSTFPASICPSHPIDLISTEEFSLSTNQYTIPCDTQNQLDRAWPLSWSDSATAAHAQLRRHWWERSPGAYVG